MHRTLSSSSDLHVLPQVKDAAEGNAAILVRLFNSTGLWTRLLLCRVM